MYIWFHFWNEMFKIGVMLFEKLSKNIYDRDPWKKIPRFFITIIT